MSRLVSRAENWEKVYTSFQNINFAAFDYDTIKQSLLDYIKLYFPESFNDFIESSELVAIIESFAYIAELLAYRLDMDAHENFISTAQRKDSILRLAKLVSYDADRPIPARGLVKITSVSTTEGVIDALGNNLANRIIKWNDSSNANWKDQFILIMNRVLSQQFGTVNPSDRFQIQDVLFELYDLDLVTIQNGVFKYSTNINGTSVPMELVPIEHDSTLGIIERRPYNNSNFSIVYGQDGLGDSSETTGFMCFTKQGTLQRLRKVFDGITPNQIYDVPTTNVNNTDVWVNNVDSITGETLNIESLLPYHRNINGGKSGEWVQVDTANSQNIIFNTNPNRNKYEIETRNQNKVRLIFGDGEFSDIPSGTFDIWLRSSLDEDIVISQSSVVDVPISFSYMDNIGRTQTFTFTVTLIDSLQNASASESLEHIRTSAPATYYTQNRMVNGQDYNTFMLQDSSILKLRTINRTFAGDSKYITWHDPSTTYENVKLFSDDGAIYYDTKPESLHTPTVSVNVLISSYIEPLLSSTDLFLFISSYEVPASQYRRTFNLLEIQQLTEKLTTPPFPSNISLYFNFMDYTWTALRVKEDGAPLDVLPPNWDSDYIKAPLISIVQTLPQLFLQSGTEYDVIRFASRLVFHSPTTRFWNTNLASTVIEYDTLKSDFDIISILQANPNHSRAGILSSNWNFNILGQEVYELGTQIGLPDDGKVSILPEDTNGDGIPDHLDLNDAIYHKGLADIIKPKLTIDLSDVTIGATGYIVSLPIYYITNTSDVTVQFSDYSYATKGIHWDEISTLSIPSRTKIINLGSVAQLSDATGLDSSTTYTTDIRVDEVIRTVTILGNDATTIFDLLDVINPLINDIAVLSLIGGNLQLESNSLSDLTQVEITENSDGIFRNLTNYIPPNTATYEPSNAIVLKQDGGTSGFNNDVAFIRINEYVYFYRPTVVDEWILAPNTVESIQSVANEFTTTSKTWVRKLGRDNLNFAWFHRSPRYHLIDPATSNIMDTFIIQKGYFLEFKRWLEESSVVQPADPTPLDLRLAYNYLLDNKMLSDTVVLHPGKFKILFGSRAIPPLQAKIKAIRSDSATLTNNQIKNSIVAITRNFFDITHWEFGETFYFSELAAVIHSELASEISSVVLVPTYTINHFGNLYQVIAKEDEVFYPDITPTDVEMVTEYNDVVLRAVPGCTDFIWTSQQAALGGGGTGIPTDCIYVDQYCDLTYCDNSYIQSLTCVPGGVVEGCVYINQYCELTYCDSTYLESLNCIPT